MGETPDELTARSARREMVEIENEIEHTRAELTGTIDTLQSRLAPDHLVEQAKVAARDASSNLVEETKTAIVEAAMGKAEHFVGKAEQIVRDVNYEAKEASDSFIDTIRQNPLPAALAGLGIGWLLSHRGNGHHPPMRTSGRWRYEDDEYPIGIREHGYREIGDREIGLSDRMGRMQDRAGEMVDGARETVSELAGSATDLASGATGRATRFATDAGSTAVDATETFWDMVRRNPMPAAVTGLGIAWMMMNREQNRFHPVESISTRIPDLPVGEVRERAVGQIQGFGTEAQHQASRARTQLECLLDDTPLAIGAAALGLGAMIGLAVPTTSRERELMGDARESLMEKGQHIAEEAQQRFMHVAEQVQETAKEGLSTAREELSRSDSGSQSAPQTSSQSFSPVPPRQSSVSEHQSPPSNISSGLDRPETRAS